MVVSHVHDAVAQVKRLQELILEKQVFRGFSGRARMAGGVGALGATLLLSSRWVPRTPTAHLTVWAGVLALALAFNFGALAHAFLFDPAFRRDPSRMKPVLDVLPPLAVGGLLSLALIRTGQYDMLFGAWMALYGLAHLACRHSLPAANYAVGLFYLACGALCWLWPGASFLNPWPMALAFLPGELAGGLVLASLREPAGARAPTRNGGPHDPD